MRALGERWDDDRDEPSTGWDASSSRRFLADSSARCDRYLPPLTRWRKGGSHLTLLEVRQLVEQLSIVLEDRRHNAHQRLVVRLAKHRAGRGLPPLSSWMKWLSPNGFAGGEMNRTGRTPSSSWSRRAAIGCGAVGLAVAAGLAGLVLLDPLCSNTVMTDVASPDGQRHAVVFRRSCRVINTRSIQVSVLPRWRSAARYGGNVFAGDAAFWPTPAHPSGEPRVAARWLDRRTLEVRYDPRARVLDMPAPLDNEVAIQFVPDST